MVASIRRSSRLTDAKIRVRGILTASSFSIWILLLTLFMCSVVAAGARAQSAYLPKGNSGWETSGEFASGHGLESGGLAVGYSSEGIVDAVVSVSHLTFPNPYTLDFVPPNRRVTGTAFLMMFTTDVVKQDSRWDPFSVDLSSGCYMGSFYSPKERNMLEMRVENGYMFYGGMIYRDFPLSPSFYIQPAVGYFYSEGFGAVVEPYDRPQVGNDYVRSVTTGVSFVVVAPGAETFLVEPAFTSSGRGSSFSIDAGVVFGTSREEGVAQ